MTEKKAPAKKTAKTHHKTEKSHSAEKAHKPRKPSVSAETRVEAHTAREASGSKRILNGVVVSNKMQKTIVVKVDRRVKDSQYMKFITLSKKYKAHDEKQEAKPGDRVEIIESKPMSKEKRWALRKIVGHSAVQGEI